MFIGLLSDTHGNSLRAAEAATMFRQFEVDRLLHCGDIGNDAVVRALADFETHYVFGNCDVACQYELTEAILAAGGVVHGMFGDVDWEGVRIAFLHGDDDGRLRSSISSAEYDLVCHGHSHLAHLSRHGRTLLVNPGALHRAAQPSIAVIELPTLEVTRISI